jgi:HD-GYP domain-containing protein (c-di-GMP phosphodiesterase class II)
VPQRVALADFADLKSTWTLGHSRGVVARALRAGSALGASEDELRQLEIAALVHDIGRVAVSNAVWDKLGPLGRGEREQVQSHAFHNDHIAAAISACRKKPSMAAVMIAGAISGIQAS